MRGDTNFSETSDFEDKADKISFKEFVEHVFKAPFNEIFKDFQPPEEGAKNDGEGNLG